MHYLQKITLLFIACAISLSCTEKDNSEKVTYLVKGRTEKKDDKIILIGSASSVTFGFSGAKCVLKLEAQDTFEHHNYISLVLDGKYIGRQRIENGAGTYPVTVKANANDSHTLTIYKATEAANGNVIFNGVDAELMATQVVAKKKIEFIGDSITCGMGNDTEEIPCDTAEWYDQHNGYFAYGPITARTLDVDYMLSSVSGIGMYRNWNDEHKDEAIMPDVYEHLYLNRENTTPYDFSFQPDVTCIALGTNDFSDGDGEKPRLPFNEDKYVNNYIDFVKMLYTHNPDTQIVLLDSPMVNGEKLDTFHKCLNRVKDAFKNDEQHKSIKIFHFDSVTPHGCGYHPDIEDHKLMASQLAPYLKNVLNEQ